MTPPTRMPPRVLLGVLLLLTGCSSPEVPPPTGLLPADLAALEDPLAAIEERLDAMEPLVELQAAQDPEGKEAAGTLQRLAREVAMLAGHEELQEMPLRAGRLRARVLFVTRGTVEERLAALEDSRSILSGMREAG